MTRRFTLLLVLVLLGLQGHSALAEPTITPVDGMYISRFSSDGSSAAGNSNDGTYSPCRWTALEGKVPLGQSSGEILGRGAGIPGISADGLQISSSIATFDSTLVTQGRWTSGQGWEQTMPPLPPGVVNIDDSIGSAWGISGDGSTVVGMAWIGGSGADASAWTAEGGMTFLPEQGHDSRANDANYDGSVIVGWTSVSFGYWQPTVWEDGVMTLLHASERWTEAKAVNPAGDIIVGTALDTLTNINSAAMWVKNEGSWDQYILGYLPGTFGNGIGEVLALDLSADGSMVVGLNSFSHGNTTGFIWDQVLGLVRADEYLADAGVALPDSHKITAVTAISDDGNVLSFTAYDQRVYPYVVQSFVVTFNDVSPVPQAPVATLDLGPARPNPFNPSTSFALTLPRNARVTLDICDVRGHVVRTLRDGPMAAGDHVVEWNGRMDDGRTAPSGMYLARARDDRGFEQTRRMMLVK